MLRLRIIQLGQVDLINSQRYLLQQRTPNSTVQASRKRKHQTTLRIVAAVSIFNITASWLNTAVMTPVILPWINLQAVIQYPAGILTERLQVTMYPDKTKQYWQLKLVKSATNLCNNHTIENKPKPTTSTNHQQRPPNIKNNTQRIITLNLNLININTKQILKWKQIKPT